jgi:hypothetical protein
LDFPDASALALKERRSGVLRVVVVWRFDDRWGSGGWFGHVTSFCHLLVPTGLEMSDAALFGEPLSSVLAREGQSPDSGVPYIVVACIERLLVMAAGGGIAELFERKETPEDKAKLNAAALVARRAYRSSKPVDVVAALQSDAVDPFAVSLLLRAFVQKLPDDVLYPRALVADMRAAVRATVSLEDRRNLVLDLVAKLPAPSVSLLRRLIGFFRKLLVAAPSDRSARVLRAMCKFFAKPLGRPKTQEDL